MAEAVADDVDVEGGTTVGEAACLKVGGGGGIAIVVEEPEAEAIVGDRVTVVLPILSCFSLLADSIRERGSEEAVDDGERSLSRSLSLSRYESRSKGLYIESRARDALDMLGGAAFARLRLNECVDVFVKVWVFDVEFCLERVLPVGLFGSSRRFDGPKGATFMLVVDAGAMTVLEDVLGRALGSLLPGYAEEAALGPAGIDALTRGGDLCRSRSQSLSLSLSRVRSPSLSPMSRSLDRDLSLPLLLLQSIANFGSSDGVALSHLASLGCTKLQWEALHPRTPL